MCRYQLANGKMHVTAATVMKVLDIATALADQAWPHDMRDPHCRARAGAAWTLALVSFHPHPVPEQQRASHA